MSFPWHIGCSKELGPYLETGDDTHGYIAYLHLPRFQRDANGWWLAPLIRIGYGKDTHLDYGVIEIPWVEHTNGKTRAKLIYHT